MNSPDPFPRAQRMTGLEISAIIRFSLRTARLNAVGPDLGSLFTGRPVIPTPRRVVDATRRAAPVGQTRRPATHATAALRSSSVPGHAFGQPGHARFSISNTDCTPDQGVARIAALGV